MEPFETERMIFRPLVMSDLKDLYVLYRQADLMQYITGKPRSYKITVSRLISHIDEWRRFGFGLCAAILKENGQMIGRCGLQPLPTQKGLQGNIAWLYAREYWNQGLATEFALTMIPIGLKTYELSRIIASADHRNYASIRVMQKAGMRFCESTSGNVFYEALPGICSGGNTDFGKDAAGMMSESMTDSRANQD